MGNIISISPTENLHSPVFEYISAVISTVGPTLGFVSRIKLYGEDLNYTCIIDDVELFQDFIHPIYSIRNCTPSNYGAMSEECNSIDSFFASRII